MPRADVHRCKCSGTRLLSAGWHSSTEKQSRQFTLNTSRSALVFGGCNTCMPRADVHRCKCSGTRLLSAGLAQQHRKTKQAVYPKHCRSALVFGG